MNPASIIVFLILLGLIGLAVRYCLRHGSCDACSGSCGSGHGSGHHCAPTGCSSCSHLEEEKAAVPERFRRKK